MAGLEQWVNDRLHDILGLSHKYVSQFMICTAQKAASSEDLVARLEQTGTIDIDQNVIDFAQELFDKVARFLVLCECESCSTLRVCDPDVSELQFGRTFFTSHSCVKGSSQTGD